MKIPEKFHNSLKDQPFTHCKMCEKELIDSKEGYLIEKAFRRFPENNGEELIFEIAICMDCAMKMRAQLSRESIKNVNRYFQERTQERSAEMGRFSEDELMNTCLLSGRPIEDTEEYQLYAHCRGGEISPMGGFYMLSGEVIEEIQDVLSPETKDELNRFSDDHLGTPPELQKLFSRGHLVTV